MTENQIRVKLRGMVAKAGSQKAVAEQLGVGEPMLSMVLSHARTPGPALLRALGLRRVVRYVRAG